MKDEDKALFRAMMDAVKPLNHRTPREPKPRPAPSTPVQRKQDPMVETPQTDYYLSNHYTTIVTPNTTLAYCHENMPRKRLRELKNGQQSYTARLDLHGLRPDAARMALCEFIDQKSRTGHRNLLIIHGKGGRFGEEPVLKNHVNHWLQQLPQVLAFHSAQPRDGGNGALYVLLKRIRD